MLCKAVINIVISMCIYIHTWNRMTYTYYSFVGYNLFNNNKKQHTSNINMCISLHRASEEFWIVHIHMSLCCWKYIFLLHLYVKVFVKVMSSFTIGCSVAHYTLKRWVCLHIKIILLCAKLTLHYTLCIIKNINYMWLCS